METGPEAKARLIKEAATRGDFGLKLCERHYFAHVSESPECVVQTAREYGEFFEELPAKIDCELDILDDSLFQLEEWLKGK